MKKRCHQEAQAISVERERKTRKQEEKSEE
jgi:hypothetical protein